METKKLSTSSTDMHIAAQLLKHGDVVAFPTETVYGLGASLSNISAIDKIYAAKGRPSDNPLIIHASSPSHIAPLLAPLSSQQESDLRKLITACWPGPLTLILPKNDTVPDRVTAGHPNLAVRIPGHPIALQLIELAGEPIVAPSANSSGGPSPTTAQHVLDDLDGKIAAVIDGGPCSIGIESTVLDLTTTVPTILRPGHYSREHIANVLGRVVDEQVMPPQSAATQAVASPGMKYRHYAPHAQVRLLSPTEVSSITPDEKILFLSNHELPTALNGAMQHPLSAQSLFHEFREADKHHIDTIYIMMDEAEKKQTGLLNRILKAAAN